MNVIFLGPQGSGKGTQAELLVAKFGFNHFEAGQILRSIANSTNPNAAMIKQAIDGGGLVPDELVRLIAWDFISKHDKSKGFIFDGYPRSVDQYEHLLNMLAKFGQKIDWVINLEISESETIRRLSARRTCTKCGEVYNLITNPPSFKTSEGQALKCDKCGGELVQRDDDKPEAIQRRLAIYRSQTHPVFERAVAEDIGVEVDGMRPIAVIHQDILSRLRLQ
mgnify:CR=1 FL=1